MIKGARKLTVKTTYKKPHVEIVLKEATPFQKRVWRVLQTIPCGETRTYKWVAQKVGKPKAARAVGQACGANPLPLIIPCHRVVASGGKLGGFSLGLAMKKRLLKWEGSL
ncbi:MAG: MGMT family protein [Deltaproteobacteria bacterium]|nr:MGMT family protein [Deltaproteobacteria bacterium]MDZ4224790.1 MGMT family protein [bacterium]